MNKERKQYSQEFKIKAVELIKQRGNVGEIAKELDISRNTLINWQRFSRKGKLDATVTTKAKVKSPEELENIRLKKELYEMKMERDILKKAVSIFSKSDQ